MVTVRPENPADVLTLECRTKFVSLEKLVPKLCGRGAKLITLFPVAPAAQTCGVVGCELRPAALAATSARCGGLLIPLVAE